jgi:hypothetical protein
LLVGDRFRPSLGNAHVVVVELRTPGAAPIVLATKLQLDTDGSGAGFEVLDLVILNGALILPVAVGTQLGLWRIEFGPITRDSWVFLEGWWVQALASRLDSAAVKVDVSQLDDRRIALAVYDKRAGGDRAPTLFEQENNEWRFRVTKKWNQK